MIAGRLDSRVEALERVESENALGERAAGWESRGWWRAERASLSGSRSEEAAEHFADYRARFNVRAGHAPKAGWRLRCPCGMLYEIIDIIPSRRRGMLALDCQRVNL